MQESTKPANFTIDENATCVDTVLRYRAENPTMPLFRRHVNGA